MGKDIVGFSDLTSQTHTHTSIARSHWVRKVCLQRKFSCLAFLDWSCGLTVLDWTDWTDYIGPKVWLWVGGMKLVYDLE